VAPTESHEALDALSGVLAELPSTGHAGFQNALTIVGPARGVGLAVVGSAFECACAGTGAVGLSEPPPSRQAVRRTDNTPPPTGAGVGVVGSADTVPTANRQVADNGPPFGIGVCDTAATAVTERHVVHGEREVRWRRWPRELSNWTLAFGSFKLRGAEGSNRPGRTRSSTAAGS
jgi:hypothetical protein